MGVEAERGSGEATEQGVVGDRDNQRHGKGQPHVWVNGLAVWSD
jgi:hypothetical protein